MEPAHSGVSDNLGPMTRMGIRRASARAVLVQAQVGPVIVIMGEVFPQQPPCMCLVNNDDVIEALATQGSDHPFAGAVLPRASKAGLFGSDAQALDESLHGSKHRVVVKEEEAGQVVERESLPELLLHPGRRGLRRHIHMSNGAAPVIQDHQHIEQAKIKRGDHHEVHGSDHLSVILQEASPPLGSFRIQGAFRQPSLYAPFREMDAQLREFCMNSGRSPGRVFPRHLADYPSGFQSHGGASWLPFGFPSPVDPEPCAVPLENRLRLHKGASLPPARPEPFKQHPEDPVSGPEGRARLLALQDSQLMTQREVL